MKTDCDVIRDLMPLTAEGIASEKSLALVQVHLEECPDCRAAYQKMNQEEIRPLRTVEPLSGFRRRIRLHEITVAVLLTAVILTPVLLLWGCFFLDPDDAAGYCLLVHILLLPAAALLLSLPVGMGKGWTRWLLPPLFGLCNLLTPLVVFHTADAWFYFLIAAVPAFIGLSAGIFIRRARKNKTSSEKENKGGES